MEIIALSDKYCSLDGECCMALGCFDGVHIGHRAVISGCVSFAVGHGIPSVVWSLRSVPGHGGIITDDAEKASLFTEIGADFAVFCDYDEIHRLSCDEFIDNVISDRFHCQMVYCGYDFTFGFEKSGNSSSLKSLLDARGIGCQVCEKVLYGDNAVSSTLIRGYLENADFEKSEKLLGHSYFRLGKVIRGRRIGHKMECPTINLGYGDERVRLPRGVYKTTLVIDRNSYPAISNLGRQPTVTDSGTLTLETHALENIGELYDQSVKVIFERFIRYERKFDSIDDLRHQIEKDIRDAYGM